MKKFLYLIIIMLIPGLINAEPTLVDNIVAVVNEKVVLQSEVDEAVGMYFAQAQKYPTDEEIVEAREQFLDQMINNMILMEEAKKEDIQIQSSEVNQALEETIGNMKASFPTQAAFEEQLKLEGLTLAELRARYREEIRNQLLINRFVDLKVRSNIEVSAQEVRQMYEDNKDDIPEQPATVTISHILIPVKTGGDREKEIVAELNDFRQQALDGQDFGELAQQHSQGPLATSGGDVGFFKAGDMMKEFEDAAFKLDIGNISEPVKTNLGYHIIKVTDKKSDDNIRASHILLKIVPGQADTLRAMEEALEAYDQIQKGESFADVVKLYSADENTKETGGDLGTFPLEELVSPYGDAVKSLAIGEVSQPIVGNYGFHLVRLDGQQASRALEFDDIRPQLEEKVRQNKMKEHYDEMLTKFKEQNYIEIREFL